MAMVAEIVFTVQQQRAHPAVVPQIPRAINQIPITKRMADILAR